MVLKMTKTEFLEKYGMEKVIFKSYYKFVFYFEKILSDGKLLTCSVDGNDSYRMSVIADKEETLRFLYPFEASVLENGIEVETFIDGY